ncbi:MAG: class I mannose-6-phosphate isomerase [Clostridia bacterium]|nr:class I mannose-6-phosphate isomerase [Clostridia bacterium]
MYMTKLTPFAVRTIWGGRKLIESYNVKTDLENCAEAWMLSCFKDFESTVSDGEYKGLTLNEVIAKEGKAILGKNAEGFDDFPVLIKFIDAADDLSVQVHPDDEYAQQYNGGFGKTECWYIMDCEPGARIIYGFKNKITTEEFAKAIEENKIEDVVNYVEVKKGDFFFIEAGTLHAICKGILLAEVQQNSNVTFRAYDYNRFDAKCNGPRPLHIKETLDVTKCEPPCPSVPTLSKVENLGGATRTELVSFELFSVNKVEVDGVYTSFADSDSFVHIMVLDGAGKISCGGISFDIAKGDGIFVPANAGKYTVEGTVEILESRV